MGQCRALLSGSLGHGARAHVEKQLSYQLILLDTNMSINSLHNIHGRIGQLRWLTLQARTFAEPSLLSFLHSWQVTCVGSVQRLPRVKGALISFPVAQEFFARPTPRSTLIIMLAARRAFHGGDVNRMFNKLRGPVTLVFLGFTGKLQALETCNLR